MRLRDENGQVVALFAVGLLIAMLGIAGLVMDVGQAYVTKRKLQSTADAAALAAAAALPSVSAATAAAGSYGAGGQNPVAGATQTTAAWCLKSVGYCYGNPAGPGSLATNGMANGVAVTETASVSTTFLKLFGVGSLTVKAKATACGLCGTKPLNIALVVDRTGSMADNISDLKQGLSTFGASLDPDLDYISLLVLPPAPGGSACTPAASRTGLPLNSGDSYPSGSDSSYTVVHYSHDYLNANGSLNANSRLVQQMSCITASGATSYKQALVAAQQELANPPAGREDAQKVIVFESDGAANTAPDSFYDATSGHQVNGDMLYTPTAAHSDDVSRPCGSAVDYASSLRASGTMILTVGYQVGQDETCYQAPHITGSTTSGKRHKKTTYQGVGYREQQEGLSASSALSQMASPGGSFTASDAASMSAVFAGIANKVQGAQLMPDSEAGS